MDADLTFEDKTYRVSLDRAEGRTNARVGDRTLEADITPISSHCFSVGIGSRRYRAYVARSDNRVFVQVEGQIFEFHEPDAEGGALSAGDGALAGGSVSSPMPGRVVKIPVAEGQEVEKNQVLVIVEAMKMENPLRSAVRGRVKRIHFAEGDLVNAGVPIVEVESCEENA